MRQLACNNFLSLLVAAVITLSATSCGESGKNSADAEQEAPGSPKKSATVYTASHIYTMDAQSTEATAVAVSSGRIVAVGSAETIAESLEGYDWQRSDIFAGKVVLPGFIDNHLHPALAGLLLPSRFITPFPWSLPHQQVEGVQGREAYLARLREVEQEVEDPDEFLITWGYHQYFHGELGRDELNAISSSRPVIVWHRSFHEILVNDAALKALDISSAEFGAHPSIDLDQGRFWETGLFAIFPRLWPLVMQPERLRYGILEGLEHARRNGVTTFCDQGVPLLDLELETAQLDAVLRESALPIRSLLIGNGSSLAALGEDAAFQLIESLPRRDTDNIRFLPRQVKLLADGAFYSQLMQMQDGYLDGHHGEWIMSPEQLESAARRYWMADYRLHIHVNGDEGLRVVLDIIEKLQNEYPRSDHATVLHHYGYSAPDQSPRVAALGIQVSANPYYLWAMGDIYAKLGMGPERAHYITRLGALERLGVPLSLHSDLPMAPAAPLRLASIAASRLTAAGNVLAPGERITIETALRGITSAAASAIDQQDSIGTIEVGKLADFTVLEQDPFEVAAENIADISIWGTVFGGMPYPNSPSGKLPPENP
jgi:predicted amidohydrolase YtcJ